MERKGMRWYYTRTEGKDYLAIRPIGFYTGRDDIDLGACEEDTDEEVTGLLKARKFSTKNIERLMGCNRREEVEKVTEKKVEAKKPVTITAAMVIEAFVKTRDEIAKKKKAFEVDVADLKITQEKRTSWLKTQMDTLGVESLKSKEFGTAFIDYKTSASVADWPAFIEWVKTEDQYDFLNHAVNKTAVNQLLDDGETLPPGVNYNKIVDVKIRRA